MVDASDRLRVFDFKGNFKKEIQLPGLGTASFMGDTTEKDLFYKFTSFTDPGSMFRVDMSDFT
jgi:prolyl oligopeptidase